jgi:hypothetical protein
VKLPKSLKDIKVKQYQTIYNDIQIANNSTGLTSIDAMVRIISFFTGHSIEYLEDLDRKVIKANIKKLSFLLADKPQLVKKYIWVNGSLYKGTNNADDLNASQIIGIKTFLSQGTAVEQLHNLAPCSYKKFKFRHQYKSGNTIVTKYLGFFYNGDDHVKLSEAFLNKPTSDVLPLVFFCFRVLYNSTVDTEAYLEAQKTIQSRMAEIHQLILDKNFLNIGAGMQQ